LKIHIGFKFQSQRKVFYGKILSGIKRRKSLNLSTAATVLNVPYILSAVVAMTKMTDFPIGIIILLKLCFVVAAFEHIHESSSDHQHQHEHQHQVYFVPTLKDAANIGDLLFAQAHFT
jgi:hypothetical protein